MTSSPVHRSRKWWDSKQAFVFTAHFHALPNKHVTVHPPAEAQSTESYLSSNPWRPGHSSGGVETRVPEERWRRCGAAACGAPSGSSPAGRSADSRSWRMTSSGADWPAAPASIRRTCSATSAASTPSSSPTMEASGWCPVRLTTGSARWSYSQRKTDRSRQQACRIKHALTGLP